jgi:polyhydroxybutyrate depolymerase
MNKKKFLIFTLFFLIAINFGYAQKKTMNYYGKNRSYKVHLPPAYNSANSYALVLVFNAWTHTMDITESHTKMSIKADSANFIVVYPDGIAGSNKEWNHDGRYTIDDVGFITELIDTLITDYSIDTKRIFAAGFSNGGGMACRLAFEFPERIAAAAPVCGSFTWTKAKAKRPAPIIHFTAKNDGDSYPGVQSFISFWKSLNNIVTGPDTLLAIQGAAGTRWKGDDSTEFRLYVTDIGGHSWPGGNVSFDTPSQLISADYLLWEFFKAHPNDGKIYSAFDSTYFAKIFTKMKKYAGMGNWNAVSLFYHDSSYIIQPNKTIHGRIDIDKYWNSSASKSLDLTCRVVSRSLDDIYNSSFYKKMINKPAVWSNIQVDTSNTYYVAGTMVYNKFTYNFINVWQRQSNGFWKILINSFVPAFNYSETKTMQHDGTKRTYKVHLPPKYNTTGHFPLVLVFNGWTHTPDNTESHTKMSMKADSAGFIVVYPAGICGTNYQWNHDDRYKTDDIGFVTELIDTLIKDYSIDTMRIYASGFSNGAAMSYRMAYELPDRIAAIAPVGQAFSSKNISPKRATPTIHFHAKNDGIVGYGTVKPVIDYWKALNKNVTGPDTFFVTSGANGIKWKGDNNTEYILYTTDIGGHSWPGGNPSFATPSQAISANDLLWDFFMAHPLNASATDVKGSIKSNLNFELSQNYPNPFNPVTRINYRLSSSSEVCLKVYDLLGRKIATLVDKSQNSGNYSVEFNAVNFPSGTYFYELSVNGNSTFKKMILLK